VSRKKIHWPDIPKPRYKRLASHLQYADFALVKWAVWLRIYATNRGLSLSQLLGMGMMAGLSARIRWVPKQQQYVDLAIAGLQRTYPRLLKIIERQYLHDGTPEEKAAALSMSKRSYDEHLKHARAAIHGALTIMASRDLIDRALEVRSNSKEEKPHEVR
jgi:hypothetical protein